MKILNWYVTKNFLITLGMAIFILTFCILGGRLVSVLEALARGVPFMVFLKFVLYNMPIILTFSIPLGTMAAVMLVFGRLSADSEITAMRACGVSILQVVSPILIITIMLSALCFYLQVQVGPPLLEKTRTLLEYAVIEEPTAMIEPGKQLNTDNMTITVDNIIDGRKLEGVQIYKYDADGNMNDFRAATGLIVIDQERERFTMELKDCQVVTMYDDAPIHMSAGDVSFTFDYGRSRSEGNIAQRAKFMTMRNLLASIKLAKLDNAPAEDICKMEVELNQRIAFALSPLAFLLLGIPLGIQTSRRETSVGMVIAAIAGGAFFLMIILCESLNMFPVLRPQYLLWLPNLGYQAVGAYMLYKITMR